MKKSVLAVVLLAATFEAFAQSAARARPPGTMPLEEAPPPPPIVQSDPALEPQGNARTEVQEGQTVQQISAAGRVAVQRVTPRNGRPYLLVDPRGDGTNVRQDILEPGLRVPQWILLEF
jgi:hypothetical protein